jgi:1,4-alpha-glucan branching enzyme
MKKQFVKSKDNFKVTFNPGVETVGEASEVVVLGDFNNWNPEDGLSLKKQKDGSFKGTIVLDKDKEYEFKYWIDGNSWVNEVSADKLISNPFGDKNSIISTFA